MRTPTKRAANLPVRGGSFVGRRTAGRSVIFNHSSRGSRHSSEAAMDASA
jgi:hypothetical protein